MFQYEGEVTYKIAFERIAARMFQPIKFTKDQLIVNAPMHGGWKYPPYLVSGAFGNQYGFPLVLLPLTSKFHQLVDGLFEDIILAGKNLIGQADEIYMIGYGAKDEIIDEILTTVKSDTKLHVIGKEDAEKIMTSILARNKKLQKGQIFQQGFEKFVEGYEVYATQNTYLGEN